MTEKNANLTRLLRTSIMPMVAVLFAFPPLASCKRLLVVRNVDMTLQESTSPTADGILVSIKNNGLSFLDEKEASLEEIEMHLRDATTIQTKPGIVLLVEDEAKQDQVLQILKLCQELDLSNVTFRDQNEDKLIE